MKLQNSLQTRLNNLNGYYLKFYHVVCSHYSQKHKGEYLDPNKYVKDLFQNFYTKKLHTKVKGNVKEIKEAYTKLLSGCMGLYEFDILSVVEELQNNNTFKMTQAPIEELPEEIEDLFFEDVKQYKKELKAWFKNNKELIKNKYYNFVIVPA